MTLGLAALVGLVVALLAWLLRGWRRNWPGGMGP
jgi:hypothetical protein